MDANMMIKVELLKIDLKAADTLIQTAKEAEGKYNDTKCELDRAQRESKKLKNPFYHPFWLMHSDFFEDVNESALTCIFSILFFGAGIAIYFFMGICGLLNLLSFLIYFVLSPIVLPLRVLAAKHRVRKLEREVQRLQKEAAKYDVRAAKAAKQELLNRMRREQPKVMKAFEEEQAESVRRAPTRSTTSSGYISDGVRQTDYYKQQYEKYYNMYMGTTSQKPAKSAYDNLLEDWAHAKDSGIFDDTNW